MFKMRRIADAALQGVRTASKMGRGCLFIRDGSRRLEPLFVRSFSRGAGSRFGRAETFFRSNYARLLSFTGGLGLSAGGLAYAGILGFGSNSSGKKNVTKLMQNLETIRAKYPDIYAPDVVCEWFVKFIGGKR